MKDKYKFGRYVIGFQGFYYLMTGLWATFFLSNFEKITMHTHDGLDFKLHMLAGAMIIVLGLYFIYSVRKKDWYKTNDIIYLVIGISLAVVIIELVYLPGIVWNLFLVDLIEEIIIIILLLWVLR